jgi:hypothetical protein
MLIDIANLHSLTTKESAESLRKILSSVKNKLVTTQNAETY